MARTDRDAAMKGSIAKVPSENQTVGIAPNCQPPSHATANLDNAFDSFMKDGLDFNNLSQQHALPYASNVHTTANGSPTSGTLHHMSHEEIHRLLSFDGSFDLELSLPDIFGDGDGNELLDLDFPGLHVDADGGRSGRGSNLEMQPPGGVALKRAKTSTAEADAARNVLASLQAGTGVEDTDSPGVASSEGGANAPFAPNSALLPVAEQQPSGLPALPQHQMGSFYPGNLNNHMSMPPPPPPHGIPVYVDPRTGEILQVAPQGHHHMPWPSAAPPQQWPGAGLPNFGPGDPTMQLLMQQQGAYMNHPGLLTMPHSMHFMGGMPSTMMMAAPVAPTVVDHPSPRKAPPKRKRASRANPESMSQRTAKAEQGFTHDPAAGRMYRHGPALEASARDNRELPGIKAIFNTFQQLGGFANAQPADYALVAAQQLQAAYGGNTTPAQATILANMQLQLAAAQQQHQITMQQHAQQTRAASPPLGQQNASIAVGGGDVDETAGGQNLAKSEGTLPSGRQLSSQTGHGFITSLVTKELQSSTPPPPSALGAQKESSTASSPELLGVSRDKWNLFFDAYVDAPPSGSTLQGQDSPNLAGVQCEPIFLGKFPTREQAGRAHDIAALKFYGETANTNFPREVYAATMPVLQEHSSAEVIAALKKDSALALQRTSKYKGVRRTGQGQYEARADLAIVNAGIDQAAMTAAAAAAAAAAGPSACMPLGPV